MQIIPATAQDQDGIKALLRACELPTDDLNTTHLEHFFVIKDSGKIVGNVGLEICDEFGLLRSLALTKSKRGSGLGNELVEHIQEYARSLQVKSIYLLTTSADHFFARIGYQVVPRESAPAAIKNTTEFQSICPVSAVCMYKELDSSWRNHYAS